MRTSFYNLSGGINKSSTKTELGMDVSKLYWSDSKNMEILQNKGIIRQKGNVLLTSVPGSEKIIAMHQMKYAKVYNLIIATSTGKLFVFNPKNNELKKLNKTAYIFFAYPRKGRQENNVDFSVACRFGIFLPKLVMSHNGVCSHIYLIFESQLSS